MVDNDFGSKLKQARTRQGISLRQASETTKIRMEFLESLESNYHNFNMPDVYKRGFLKVYSRYLRLDPDEILRLCTAATKDIPSKRISWLDREDVTIPTPSYAKTQPSETKNPSQSYLFDAPAPTIASLQTTVSTTEEDIDETEKYFDHSDKGYDLFAIFKRINFNSIYTKITLIGIGTLLTFGAVTLMISKISKGATTASQSVTPAAPTPKTKPTTTVASAKIPASTLNEALEDLILKSTNDVHIIVRQEQDKKWLYSGNLSANSPLTIARKGPVKIHFSNGSDLVIQRANGQKVKPGKNGVGWIEL